METAINVAVFGMEQRAINTLELTFKNRANGVCHIVEASQAQVALFNLDFKDARQLFNNFHKSYPNIPTIGICTKNLDDWEIPQITVPLSAMTLVKAILDAKTKLSTIKSQESTENSINIITKDKIALAMKAIESRQIAENLNKRVNKNSKNSTQRIVPDITTETSFDTNRFLLGYALDAINKCSANDDVVLFTCLDDKNILINPKKSEVITDLTNNQIRTLAIVPLDKKLVLPITSKHGKLESFKKLKLLNNHNAEILNLEVFMWNLGLMTSRGRIPSDISTETRHYLTRWPNLTRLTIPENAMRIISYWTRNPCSIMDIHKKLDIPLQNIFNVFTASYSIGLTQIAKRESDQLIKNETIYHNDKRGLFASIINRLHHFNDDKNTKTG
ncbi:hypothetical protein MNBD_GAMMA22-2202 [hydrothermal vent metagenome]|uniref:Uncharacterized protein n=1 Tax=hydrothermal vent metagenome TaxID=652676 RepID=A0A3B0ZRF6_9ZZZZ